jgi:transposase-like protein
MPVRGPVDKEEAARIARLYLEEGMSITRVCEEVHRGWKVAKDAIIASGGRIRPNIKPKNGDLSPDQLAARLAAQRAVLEARGEKRCLRCGIILARSGDMRHPNDDPKTTDICHQCRRDMKHIRLRQLAAGEPIDVDGILDEYETVGETA